MEGNSEGKVLQASKTILTSTKRRKWTKIRSLDGAYRNYTTAVLISMSLGITILFFERGLFRGRSGKHFLLGELHEVNVAGKRVITSLLLLLAAAVIGAVSHVLLVPNLKTMQHQLEVTARRWIFYSILGVLTVNCLSLLLATEAESAFQIDKDESIFVSAPAHYILLAGFLISILVLDTLYLHVILLPFVEVDNRNRSRAVRNWSRVRSIVFYHPDALQRLGRDTQKGLCQFCLRKYNSLVDILAVGAMHGTQHAVNTFQIILCCGSSNMNGGEPRKNIFQKISSKGLELFWTLKMWITTCRLARFCALIAEGLTKFVDQITRPIVKYCRKLRDWGKAYDTSAEHPWYQQLCYAILMCWENMITGINTLRYNIKNFFKGMWKSINEDEEFSHSSWVNAAVISSIFLLVYFGLILVQGFHGFYKDLYLPHRNCARENSKVTDFFLRTAGFSGIPNESNQPNAGDGSMSEAATFFQQAAFDFEIAEKEGSISIPTCSGYMLSSEVTESPNNIPKAIYAAVVAYEKDREAQESRSPTQVFQRTSIGSVMYVLDVVMSNMDWSVWLGLSVGLVVGLFSLLSVFAQYKRVSFAIRSGIFERLPADVKQMIERLDDYSELQQHEKWERLFKAYPMSLSVFFFGMLVSTAVVQLAVFGLLVSLLLAVPVSLLDSEVYRILKPFMALLVAFLLTWFLHGFMATKLLGDTLLLDGDSVVHEMGFLLFLLVYTALHLVLGIFLAIIRLLILMLLAFSRINRLDTNLYVAWKHLDRGHKSFIAMVLLQFAFQTSRSENDGALGSWRSVLGQLRIQIPSESDVKQSEDSDPHMVSNSKRTALSKASTSTVCPSVSIEVSPRDDSVPR